MTDIATLGIAINTSGITQANQSLNILITTANNTDDAIQDITDSSNAANNSFSNTTTATNKLKNALIGLASAATGALAVDKIIKFQDSMLGLQATANATAKEMVNLEKQARELGATSVFSAAQVGNAQKFLAQAGFDTNEILKSTSATLQLASAGSLDLASAADIASNVIGGMRLEVTELDRVVDVLAATSSLSNTNITQLGSALSKAAPLAAAAGIDIEDVSAAIGVLSNNGLQADVAATGLGGIIRQLTNLTPKATAVLKSYGLSAADVSIESNGLSSVLAKLGGVTISAGDAIKVFGSEAAAAGLILGSSGEQFDKLTASLDEAEGSSKRMSGTLSSELSGSFKSLASAAEEAVLQVGDAGLSSALDSTVDGMTALISSFTGMLPLMAEANELSSDYVDNVNFLADALKAVALGLGVAATAAVSMIALTKTLTIATVALTAVANANPFVLLARAVGVVGIAVGTYIGLTSDATEEVYKLNKAVNENTLSFSKNGEILGEITEKSIFNTIVKINAEIAAIELSNAAIKTQILQLNALGEAHSENQGIIDSTNASIIKLTLALGASSGTLDEARARVERLQVDLKTFGTTVENNTGKTKKNETATGKLTQAQKDLKAAMKEGLRVFSDTRTPLEQYRIEHERLSELLKLEAINQDTFSRAVRALNEDLQDATGVTKENEDALKALEDQQQKTFDSWSENITDLIGGSKDLGDVLDDLARKLLQDAFVNPLLISVGLGPSGSAGGSFVGGGSSGSFDLMGAISGGFDAFGAATGGAFNSFAKSGVGSALGLSTTSQAFTGAKMGIGSTTSLTGAGDFLSGGFSGFSAGGGIAANLLGLGSGDMLTDTVASTLGGAVGTAIGGPIGGAIGSFLGTAFGGAFGGSGEPTSFSFTSQDNEERFEGRNALTLNNEFGETLFKVFKGRSEDTKIVEAMTPILGAVSSLESIIAKTLDAGQIERITSGVSSADFRSEDPDEAINSFVAARMAAILNEIDPVFTSLTESSEKVGIASLDYLTALVAINENLSDAGPLIDLFDGNLESTVAFLNQIKTEEQTVTQAFEALAIAQASYYQNFFSEEERFETALNSAQTELDLFNSSIGLTGEAALDTKTELRDYIEALDLTTVAGRKALESALGLQGALLFVASAADTAAQAAEKSAAASIEAAEKLAAASIEAAEKLEKQALQNSELFLKERSKLLESEGSKREKEANSIFGNIKASINASEALIKSNISSIESIISSVFSSRQALRGNNGSASRIDFDRSREIVRQAAAGTAFDPDVLKSALSKVSQPSEDLFSNFTDYQREFYKTSIDMANISKLSKDSLSEEEKALNTLRSIEQDAQKQIDSINGVNSSVIDVNSSIADLSAAIKAVFDARSDIASSGGAGNVANNNSLESLYTVGLGRDPDQAGIEYWQSLLDNGVSFESVRDTFFKAAAQNGETVIAPNISGTDTGSSAIDALYTAGLGREPDPAGAAYWQSLLDSGISFNTIKDSFFQAAIENGEQNINAFANGGMHSGGLRIVGERGPELEFTGPSRIMNNSDLKTAISGNNSGNSEHESKMNMILSKMSLLIDRMYRQQQEWTNDALNVRVVTP